MYKSKSVLLPLPFTSTMERLHGRRQEVTIGIIARIGAETERLFGPFGFGATFSQNFDRFGVERVIAVGHVQPHHIHPRVEERHDSSLVAQLP
jgi:hypothetical protein